MNLKRCSNGHFYDVDKFVSFFSSIHRSNKLVDNSVKIFFRRKVDLNSSRVIFVITKSNGETK